MMSYICIIMSLIMPWSNALVKSSRMLTNRLPMNGLIFTAIHNDDFYFVRENIDSKKWLKWLIYVLFDKNYMNVSKYSNMLFLFRVITLLMIVSLLAIVTWDFHVFNQIVPNCRERLNTSMVDSSREKFQKRIDWIFRLKQLLVMLIRWQMMNY